MTNLQTDRLLLRKWKEEDLDAYAQFFEDGNMARFVGGKLSRHKAWRQMSADLGHWTLRGFGIWALEEKATGRAIGCTGLQMPEGWPEVELGYWLLKDAQGRGYATEAGAEAVKYAFGVLRVNSLVSFIHAENERSKRVALRLGAFVDGSFDLPDIGSHIRYKYPANLSAAVDGNAP